MGTDGDDTVSGKTVVERPARDEVPATVQLPRDLVPQPAELARIAAGKPPISYATPSLSLTSAADAMRDEEIQRTRMFIAMGWVMSVAAIGTVPFLDAPHVMAMIFIASLVVGMIVSFGYYRAFADPARYTESAITRLAIMCVINGHIAVLFYGMYSAAPLMVVVGLHFIARTELERVARSVLYSAITCSLALSIPIITGLIADPGVFASDRDVPALALAAGTAFVLGAYLLAYYTARIFRNVSLSSIEELQRATRLASQREALMEELRADLERALRVGGPGRYTDQTVGSFRLGIVLGRGAMGEVYEATRTTGEAAAVKLLRRELLADATHVARFLREVRASAAIDSPHVVKILETPADDALPYLAMERLHGHTLAELLRREPKLPTAATVELCRQAAIGIDAAARLGIVHRDLKPQNLFRCEDGTWKVLDFGVAAIAEESGHLTQGDVVGTPHYMAPEQAQGRTVDSRADVYSLAAIAYRCLTGRYPFTAADTPALLYGVVHRMPVRPGELAELPADVDRWCAIALAKSPGDRFESGAALVEHLERALAGELDPKLRRRADALIRRRPWEAA